MPVLVDDNNSIAISKKIKEINLLIKDSGFYLSEETADIRLTEYSSGFFTIIKNSFTKNYPQLSAILFKESQDK